MKVGFVGLGVMGAPMARNLVRGGFDVLGFARRQGPRDVLVKAGGSATATLSDLDTADIVITMLPDDRAVESVALGDGGMLHRMKPGSLFIDMSTVSPATAVEASGLGTSHGVGVLDAPVSGGEAGAIEGNLSVMVGGEPAQYELARPILDCLGSTIMHVGPAGSGQLVKAANQVIVAGNIELVAEAAVLLEASGVDVVTALGVLSGGLAGSAVLSRKGRDMLEGDFRPGFRMELHHKDLGIALSAARAAGVTLPLGSAVAELVGSIVAMNFGALDHGALIELVRLLSGRTSRITQGEGSSA